MRVPRVGPWGPKVRGGGAARGANRGWRSRRFRAGAWAASLLGGGRGRRRPSTFALGGATGKGNVRRRRSLRGVEPWQLEFVALQGRDVVRCD